MPWISKWSKKKSYQSPQLSAAEGEDGGGSGDGAEGDGDGIGVGVAGMDEADVDVASSANPTFCRDSYRAPKRGQLVRWLIGHSGHRGG